MSVKPHVSLSPVTTAPWPRYVVDAGIWEKIIDCLANGTYSLLGLWAESSHVHMSIYCPASSDIDIISLPVVQGSYPSVARKHLPALRMERTITDLLGIKAEGCPDTRPWLDHGKWPVSFPLTSNPVRTPLPDYKFLPINGEGLHQIPVGPIHAGIIEPGHFRFTCNGETVVRLEERLGFVHKGIEKLFEGADLSKGAKLAGRISGDSTVAYAFAFARAVEVALGLDIPPRAQWLRALMAEMERMANHLGDIGAVCNDAAFSFLHAHFGILREEVLRLSDVCFGHRLAMDCIIPGGVTVDLQDDARRQLSDWVEQAEKRFDALVKIYDETSSLKNRTKTTGYVREDLVNTYAAGGFVGRASGRSFDARKQLPYLPYDKLEFEVTVLQTCDVNARVWVRVCEVKQVFSLIRQIVAQLPKGAVKLSAPISFQGEHEGMALVEGFRGDVLLWLRLKDNKIKRCYPRDPSWFQWPLLENCIKDNIVADFPLCNKSFNCSYSGHDG